jgi:hypothetical protein
MTQLVRPPKTSENKLFLTTLALLSRFPIVVWKCNAILGQFIYKKKFCPTLFCEMQTITILVDKKYYFKKGMLQYNI